MSPLRPISTSQAYVSGDVFIDESAAIAPGVLIQADRGCYVAIAAGVCIGMGVIIHARNGSIEIGPGVNLGAGVLVFGHSKIGEQACIGSTTTLVNAVVTSGQVIPAGSLIGDTGQNQESVTNQNNQNFTVTTATTSVTATVTHTESHTSQQSEPINNAKEVTEITLEEQNSPPDPETSVNQQAESPTIAKGQEQLSKLMGKLFTSGINLNNSSPSDSNPNIQ